MIAINIWKSSAFSILVVTGQLIISFPKAGECLDVDKTWSSPELLVQNLLMEPFL